MEERLLPSLQHTSCLGPTGALCDAFGGGGNNNNNRGGFCGGGEVCVYVFVCMCVRGGFVLFFFGVSFFKVGDVDVSGWALFVH